MRTSNITASLMVGATLVAIYMAWATQRISPSVLAGDDRWPRPWPYPDGWLFAWERKLESTRQFFPIESKGMGQTERLMVRVRRLEWSAGGVAATSALVWMLVCWRASSRHRLTGAAADYADGLVPGSDGLPQSRLARSGDRFGAAVRQARRSLVRAGFPAGLVAGLALAGLSSWPDKAAEPTPPVPLMRIHASFFSLKTSFYGGDSGWALWAKADGTAIFQEVSPALRGERERRYQLTLTASQWREIERLIGEHDFLRLGDRLRPRPGRGTIASVSVVPSSGPVVSIRVSKPEDHPDFQAVFEYLRGLWTGPAGKEPVYVGPFERAPEGF
jgi:hypothetical protein